MASDWTNKGKVNLLNIVFRGATPPTDFYIMLLTADDTPDADINTVSDVTEIAAGNGYTTGGYKLDRNSTDFDTMTEVDATDYALIQAKDVVWTASGGTIPASGTGARWAILTDDNATIGSREVWAWWDLTSAMTVSNGQPLSLANLQLDIT